MNIRIYYFYKLIQHLIPIYPIYLMLFESKGISAPQISLLLAIWTIPAILFEIPTGILADHWNRKYMLIIGNSCKAGCYLLWFFSETFTMFALGFLLWGLSEAFCSGSEEALLFDNLKLQKREHQFDEVYGKGHFYNNIGVAISGISGGFLAMEFGVRFVLAVSVLSALVCVALTTRFQEVNFFKSQKTSSSSMIANTLTTLRDSTSFCIGNGRFLVVILLFILVIGMSGILDEYDPLIAQSYGLNLGLIGLWGFGRYILEALGGRTAYRFSSLLAKVHIKDRFSVIMVICILAGTVLIFSGLLHSIVVIPLYGMFYFLMSAAGVMHEDIIQQKIDEQGRSTVHSLISLVNNLYGLLFFALFSFTLTQTNMFGVLVIIAVYILVICFVLRITYKYKGKKAA